MLMAETLHDVLKRLEGLLAEMEQLEEPVRARVFELLDGVDVLHRTAIHALVDELDEATVERVREHDPAVAWLLDAYGSAPDEADAANAALESIRPYVQSHGGEVAVLEATGGVVKVRLSGSCSGCTASSITLRMGVERALRESLPGFVALEVEEDDAPEHPPPGPTLLEIEMPGGASQ